MYQHLNLDLIKRPDHKYPTNLSQSSFNLKRYSLNSPLVDLSYGMLLIKQRKIFNLVLSFKSKLNQS